MQISTYLTQLTGLTAAQLFGSTGAPSLVRVRQDAAGNVTLAGWAVPGVAEPTEAQIVAALAAPEPSPSPATLLAYASAAQNIALAQVFTFNVAAAGSPAHNVTTRLDAAGSGAVNKIATWAILNASTSPAPTMPYSDVDFTPTTLAVAEAASLAAQAGAIELDTFALLNQLQAGITATPPTVTTTAQIDAAGWPAAGTPGA